MNVTIVGQRIDRVRNLAGFKISHRVPAEVNDFSKAFVARIAADQIDADLGEIYDELRTQFRFKRTDMMVSTPADGRGSIATPYFEYSVIVSLNSHDPSQVIWQRQVSEIREPGQVLAEPFAAVFGSMFNTVELAPPKPVDLEAFIDRVEDLASEQVTLSYDKDATWCRVSVAGIAGEMEITARTLSLVQRNPKSPGILLQSFLDFQAALIETYGAGMIAFDGSSKPG